ncbi:MAG: hypothetical protein H7235_02170 [Bdellovibrionaceae bacterium]|nr:hypothetical protein [Pseudobdellovibrionaceae bacterium]
MESVKIKRLPYISHYVTPHLNSDWQQLAFKFGNTICLAFGKNYPVDIQEKYARASKISGFPLRFPHFAEADEFISQLEKNSNLSPNNLEFLKYIVNFYNQTTRPQPGSDVNGIALYFAAAQKPTPAHLHVFDSLSNSDLQLTCWFSENHSVFPKFEFMTENGNTPWPDMRLSNAYLIDVKIPHRGDSGAKDILFVFSFCREVVEELLQQRYVVLK